MFGIINGATQDKFTWSNCT